MHKLQSDELPVKIATVLREYETAHPDIDITIDVTLSMGGINCGTRLLSASYAQKDLDRLSHIGDRSSGPPEELSDHMTWVSNTGNSGSYRDQSSIS